MFNNSQNKTFSIYNYSMNFCVNSRSLACEYKYAGILCVQWAEYNDSGVKVCWLAGVKGVCDHAFISSRYMFLFFDIY